MSATPVAEQELPVTPRAAGKKNPKSTEALVEFKARLQKAFSSRKDAFKRLDNSGDKLIDREEFAKLVAEMFGAVVASTGMANAEHANLLFDSLDVNGDGDITPEEFKALFRDPEIEAAEAAAVTAPPPTPAQATPSGFPRRRGCITQEVLDRQPVDDGKLKWKEESMKTLMEFKEVLKSKFDSKSIAWIRLGGRKLVRIHKDVFREHVGQKVGVDHIKHAEKLFTMLDDDSDDHISKDEFAALFMNDHDEKWSGEWASPDEEERLALGPEEDVVLGIKHAKLKTGFEDSEAYQSWKTEQQAAERPSSKEWKGMARTGGAKKKTNAHSEEGTHGKQCTWKGIKKQMREADM